MLRLILSSCLMTLAVALTFQPALSAVAGPRALLRPLASVVGGACTPIAGHCYAQFGCSSSCVKTEGVGCRKCSGSSYDKCQDGDEDDACCDVKSNQNKAYCGSYNQGKTDMFGNCATDSCSTKTMSKCIQIPNEVNGIDCKS
jgi:hypothetical protein